MTTGVAFGMDIFQAWNIETTVSELRTIDSYVPAEIVPKHVIVTGSIGCLHIPGIGPLNDQAASMQGDIKNFLHQKYITIEVRDSQTDNLLFYTNKAMVVSRNESYQSEQIGQMTLQWRAIGWQDAKNTRYDIKDPLAAKEQEATKKTQQNFEKQQNKWNDIIIRGAF